MSTEANAKPDVTETAVTNKTEKAKPGEKWKANEQHVLPKNRIGIVFTGLCLSVFLAAIDQVRGSAV